jgi:hypothetical protein
MVKKAKETHICSGCIGEFDGKDLFHALKKAIVGSDYYTIYCAKCIEKIGYKEFTPYYTKKEKVEKPVKEKKPAVKKPAVKKTTVKKPTKKKE